MGGEELKWHQLPHHQLMSQQGLILVHTVKLNPIIKAKISGKMVASGISVVAFASVSARRLICNTLLSVSVVDCALTEK